MKKITILITLILLLTACSSSEVVDPQYEVYKTTYQNILNTTSFSQTSNNFNIEVSLVRIDSAKYRYDVFVDEAKIAMYDVEILAIVDEGLLMISDQMMPSIGIYGNQEYALIPFQVNAELGYVEGFNLNGMINDASAVIKVQVIWKDYFKIRTYKENFEFEVQA